MDPSRIDALLTPTAARITPSESEEAREFLQERLCTLGRMSFFFVLAYFVLGNLSLLVAGRRSAVEILAEVGSLTTLVNAAMFGGVWLVCRRFSVPFLGLKTLDALSAVWFGTSIAVWLWFRRSDPTLPMGALTPITFVLAARAVVVPSTVVRTAAISLAGYAPAIAVSFLVWSEPDVPWIEGLEQPSWSLHAVRALLGAALSAAVSGVIHGLRHQVHRARQLGQYRLESKLGEGGMGEVYRARHAMLRRPTAIKLLSPEKAGDRSIGRFEREVQLTSRLTHPNTIAIFDYGRTPGGIFYYAMEYLEGMNLDQLVHVYGPQPAGRTIHILRQVCASLAEAHGLGLIHRDVKPANIILSCRGGVADFVKVVDFGLVKDIESGQDVTLSSQTAITGTPLYMSPEAIRTPQRVDARSDIYAVGAVGYWLLTGHPLFDSTNFMEICSHQIATVPTPPSERLGRPIATDLEGLVRMCLEKDPERRPRDANALRSALGTCGAADEWTEDAAIAWWKDLASAKLTVGAGDVPTRAETKMARAEIAGQVTVDVDPRR